MTKSDELDLLKRFVEKLPEHGYVAPFLKSLLPQLEQDMRNDFFTVPDVRAMQAEIKMHQEALKDLQRSCDLRVEEVRKHDAMVKNLAEQKLRYLRELDEIRRKLANLVGTA